MENAELIKIVIAAAVGAALKETFSVLIRSSSSVVATAIRTMLPWIVKNFAIIDLCGDIAMLLFMVSLFLWLPAPDKPATYLRVKVEVIMGLLIVSQGFVAQKSIHRYKNRKRSEQAAPHNP